MAGAIIGGIVSAGLLTPPQIAVYDVNTQALERYTTREFSVFISAAALVGACDYVVLSVKPQNFTDVLAQIKPTARPETVFVSIAAGIGADFIKTGLSYDAKLIRVMPNTPLLIGSGSSALTLVPPATQQEFDFVFKLFSAAGAAERVSPDQMNEVIALNGSSPAYIYLFAKAFVDHAVTLGFDADTANRLFCNSLIGSAKMMLEMGKTHQELIDMVTSPGGTTFAGLEALRRGGFEAALTDCYDATTKRAYELGK